MRTHAEEAEAQRILNRLAADAVALWGLGIDPVFIVSRAVEDAVRDGVERGGMTAFGRAE